MPLRVKLADCRMDTKANKSFSSSELFMPTSCSACLLPPTERREENKFSLSCYDVAEAIPREVGEKISVTISTVIPCLQYISDRHLERKLSLCTLCSARAGTSRVEGETGDIYGRNSCHLPDTRELGELCIGSSLSTRNGQMGPGALLQRAERRCIFSAGPLTKKCSDSPLETKNIQIKRKVTNF
jgi:hypothetical protein